MTSADDDIRRLQRLAAAAWPAPVTQELDGWVLQAGYGVTHRANSALTLDDGGRLTLDEKLAAAEAFAAENGIPPAFQLTVASRPEGLDQQLAARGFRSELPVEVMVADIGTVPHPPDGVDVRRAEVPDDTWVAVWWPGLGEGAREIAADVLRQPLDRVIHVSVVVGGYTVAVGRGVVDQGWLGVYGMSTWPHERRRGFGRVVLADLLAWGAEQGVEHAYLLVEATNVPARKLYERAGFRPHHQYWYRVKGTGPPFD